MKWGSETKATKILRAGNVWRERKGSVTVNKKNKKTVPTEVIKACAGWGQHKYSSTHSLSSALDGGEWSVSCFTSRETAHDTS